MAVFQISNRHLPDRVNVGDTESKWSGLVRLRSTEGQASLSRLHRDERVQRVDGPPGKVGHSSDPGASQLGSHGIAGQPG